MTSSSDFILDKYPAEEIPEYLGGILNFDICHQVSSEQPSHKYLCDVHYTRASWDRQKQGRHALQFLVAKCEGTKRRQTGIIVIQ